MAAARPRLSLLLVPYRDLHLGAKLVRLTSLARSTKLLLLYILISKFYRVGTSVARVLGCIYDRSYLGVYTLLRASPSSDPPPH